MYFASMEGIVFIDQPLMTHVDTAQRYTLFDNTHCTNDNDLFILTFGKDSSISLATHICIHSCGKKGNLFLAFSELEATRTTTIQNTQQIL